jgi:restriction system protein
MKVMKLNENSLFAILLRSPWWMSLTIALGVFVIARLFVPPLYAALVPFPFIAIAGVVIWRELRKPSAARVAKKLEALRALPREEFAAALERGFRREGYGVNRLRGEAVDFELTRAGRVSLVDCRRWKATRTGIEPLREFHALGEQREAWELIYVAAGQVTDNAQAFAKSKNIRLLGEAELARLVG